ncbi:glucose-6-phosphate dehydrogenase [Arachidicoccus ginsenosidimutans]|uniref:glucose-6-phosphate dehydrogenase n=1 Tax=Arachidicoccus sp. BS20 TaxID=1850526 RepID=UPI0007F16A6F|nr:glucose-6-phosphate dehydrogenase [Arachidicoccus sp. BS20]ANI89125.1 glucose-6-phosphate dehydrogenase [Arachidicoccus sp. BS20]
MNKTQLKTANIVIFGGNGDLAWRKLFPALYNLYIYGFLPKSFAIYGVDYLPNDDANYKKHLLDGINNFSRSGKADAKQWEAFSKNITYLQGDFTKDEIFITLGKVFEENDKQCKSRGERIFYYSVSPKFIEIISESLSKFKLTADKNLDRIIIEKPFGTDLKTAQHLNKFLQKHFAEKQIFRIDHYLGKETVQNIMAFRFANNVFDPLWNNKYIDYVQITVAEEVSVGSRGGYYDGAGALRDMIQNHLLQLLCVVAMECPINYEAENVRNMKVDILNAIRKIKTNDVFNNFVRAQYIAGEWNGVPQAGYKQEKDVAKSSTTETFVAGKFFIDNSRWKGVPFYLRTGKCMEQQASVVVIQFKDAPHKIFKDDKSPNRLIFSIQPQQEISLLFESKIPGMHMKLKPVEMDFTYRESYTEAVPEAYESLLLDVLEGDATLFMRADQIEAAWKIVMPILDAWKKFPSRDLKKYKPGTLGPKAANDLITNDKFEWVLLPEQLMTKNMDK